MAGFRPNRDRLEKTYHKCTVCSSTSYLALLQMIETSSGEIVLYTRWGRTGTSGTCKKETCDDADEGMAKLAKVFQSKTGSTWDQRNTYQHMCALGFPLVPGI